MKKIDVLWNKPFLGFFRIYFRYAQSVLQREVPVNTEGEVLKYWLYWPEEIGLTTKPVGIIGVSSFTVGQGIPDRPVADSTYEGIQHVLDQDIHGILRPVGKQHLHKCTKTSGEKNEKYGKYHVLH